MSTDMNTHAEIDRSFERYFRQNRLRRQNRQPCAWRRTKGSGCLSIGF